MEGTSTPSVDWNAARAVAMRCGPGTRRLVEAQDVDRLALWLPAMLEIASPPAVVVYRWLWELLLGEPAGGDVDRHGDVLVGGAA
jgi:hypothetical protein